MTPIGRDILTLITGSDTTLQPSCPVTAQPMGDGHNSANKKSLCLKLFPLMNFFSIATPPKVHKRALSSFVILDVHVVCH